MSTKAFQRFFQETNRVSAFVNFTIEGASMLDTILRTLLEGLRALPDEATLQPTLLELVKKAKATKETDLAGPLQDLVSHMPLMLELIFVNSCDNFLTYISDLMVEVFVAHPGILKSQDKISVDWALQYDSRAELLDALTERKVINLSFNGLRDLQRELKLSLNFTLFEDEIELERAAVIVEKRNLLAHNRGIVNRRYLERVKNAKEKLNGRLGFEPQDVMQDLLFLNSSAQQIDARAITKFSLASA